MIIFGHEGRCFFQYASCIRDVLCIEKKVILEYQTELRVGVVLHEVLPHPHVRIKTSVHSSTRIFREHGKYYIAYPQVAKLTFGILSSIPSMLQIDAVCGIIMRRRRRMVHNHVQTARPLAS